MGKRIYFTHNLAFIGVAMTPGLILLTVIVVSASSAAKLFVNNLIPPLVVLNDNKKKELIDSLNKLHFTESKNIAA